MLALAKEIPKSVKQTMSLPSGWTREGTDLDNVEQFGHDSSNSTEKCRSAFALHLMTIPLNFHKGAFLR